MSDKSNAKVAGSVGSAGTVGAIGYTAAGMSAAQMTGTLATIGATVGGGMAAGVVVVAAAPIAVGALAYGIWSLFDDD